MKRTFNLLVLVAVLALAFGTQGATPARSAPGSITTTYAGGNGQTGVMFDVTAINTLSITGFDISCGTGVQNFQVWYKVGSYVGFENNQAAWTLQGAVVSLACNGFNVPTYLNIGGILIPAGQTYGIYITGTPTGAYGVDYTNGSTTYSNADIQLDLGIGIEYPFGTIYSPRIWNGTVYYNTLGPIMDLSATSFDFGDVLVGDTSASQTLWITNTGNSVLDFTGLSLNTHPPFNIDDTSCGGFLNAGDSCYYDLSFTTYSLGPVSGDLTITSDAPGSPHVISLTGNGVSLPTSGTNLLVNPGYDDFITAPKAWLYSVVNTPLSSLRDCNYYISPGCSLKLQASRTTRVVTQTVTYNGVGGEDFIWGLSSAAQNVPAGGSYKVEISLFNRFSRVMYTNTMYFNDGTHDWQTTFGSFTAPAPFNKMRFRIYFQKGAGIAWFDDAYLVQQP